MARHCMRVAASAGMELAHYGKIERGKEPPNPGTDNRDVVIT